MTFVSPGAYSREIDLSLYAPALSTTILGLVGGAHKGPINERTFVSSIPQYVRRFGVPTTEMGRSAFQYLRFGRQLQVLRVADDDAAKAFVNILGGGVATLLVEAESEGEWANAIQAAPLPSGLTLRVSAGTTTGVKIVVFEDGKPVETWDDITKANAEATINGTAPSGGPASQFITVSNILSNANEPDVDQDLVFAGGNSGLVGLNDADYIGIITGNTRTGLQAFSNPEIVDLNLVAVPGQTSGAVQNAILDLCTLRGDCMGLHDTPFGLSVQGVRDYHNGAGAFTGMHAAFNSSYGELTWPWHQVFDPYTGTKVWIPPSGVTASIIAFNDFIAEVWSAPAGLNRGRAPNSLQIEYSPDQGDRDFLMGPGSNVNTYVNFVTDGIVLYGQKTLQRKPTALDRVNVRRMLLYVEKVLASVVRYLVFEPADPRTQRQFVNLAESVLAPVQSRRGIFDFRVICDDSTNPPEIVDQNSMVGKTLIKPTKTAEVIRTDWTVLSTGALFEEFI